MQTESFPISFLIMLFLRKLLFWIFFPKKNVEYIGAFQDKILLHLCCSATVQLILMIFKHSGHYILSVPIHFFLILLKLLTFFSRKKLPIKLTIFICNRALLNRWKNEKIEFNNGIDFWYFKGPVLILCTVNIVSCSSECHGLLCCLSNSTYSQTEQITFMAQYIGSGFLTN